MKQKIVVIYPGWKGEADGYNGKYLKIGQLLIKRNIANRIVSLSNFPIPGVNYEQSLKDRLRKAISDLLANKGDLILYLMGFSAGASAIAAVAHEYLQVEKILLMAPSADAGIEDVKRGISEYGGELYITVGADDRIVGTEFPKLIADLAIKVGVAKLIIVPNCDHQFRGERNGKIMSKAFLWAFEGDETYPSPDGGIKLYD